jgi:hypothetical protein
MKRRDAMGLLGAGATGLAFAAGQRIALADEPPSGKHDHAHEHDPKHQQMIEECLAACSACETACEKAFHHCLGKTAEGGGMAHAKSAHMALDCASFCNLSATLIARHSPLMNISCEACADACQQCAKACEETAESNPVMKECIAACRKCEESCRSMVKAMGHHGAAHHEHEKG